jgi:hypothetical protein
LPLLQKQPASCGGLKKFGSNRLPHLMRLYQFAPEDFGTVDMEGADAVPGGGTTTDHDNFSEGTQSMSGLSTGAATVPN